MGNGRGVVRLDGRGGVVRAHRGRRSPGTVRSGGNGRYRVAVDRTCCFMSAIAAVRAGGDGGRGVGPVRRAAGALRRRRDVRVLDGVLVVRRVVIRLLKTIRNT
jgi:hypothetical protein